MLKYGHFITRINTDIPINNKLPKSNQTSTKANLDGTYYLVNEVMKFFKHSLLQLEQNTAMADF